jgi:hypothetical protein
MKNILITGIGGPTPRSIAKTIQKTHPDYKLIGIDANPKALGFFMPGIVHSYFVAPRMDNPAYWPFIFNLIEKEKIDMAFVQPELEVIGWGNYYNEHGSFPCPVFIPPVELATALMDKSIMADVLEGTDYIPKTIKITQSNPRYDDVEKEIGFPCWIRATKGSGGLGSLKLTDLASYKSWLFINNDLNEFTVSDFLTGRHLATQMLYYNDEYIKGASLDCAEYVMASIAPSKVTGNTSFGKFLNEDRILEFCDDCVKYICTKLDLKAHGVLSFDLKEDSVGNLKVTEINIRHMAYTGVMASVGFDLMEDTITLLKEGNTYNLTRQPYFRYDKPYVFLRDVDTEPVVLNGEHIFQSYQSL